MSHNLFVNLIERHLTLPEPSVQEAIDYMESTIGSERSWVVTEIERYAIWPGQALGYKTGMLKIQDLRERCRVAMGDDFDIGVFHDLNLGKGSMPMTVVERRVDAWLAETLGN